MPKSFVTQASSGRPKYLRITPSAVSQHIRALEEEVGAVLIVRDHPCRPTYGASEFFSGRFLVAGCTIQPILLKGLNRPPPRIPARWRTCFVGVPQAALSVCSQRSNMP
ncbi:LysR family transcriptional regulator [Rhizobium leguminosarum]|uniref:LysR family transcriptional regulator n=1 Tax=Rhizobium leguminosarum TaxID=384 RepID=UPI001FEF8ACF|nr:LysR family transcriptional regulator [Rhizobium leguminosarum]